MVDGIGTLLWVAGIAFVVSWFFRFWWVAALITAGVIWMALSSPAFDGEDALAGLLAVGLISGVPAFAGAALGKFMYARRRDPLDPDPSRRA